MSENSSHSTLAGIGISNPQAMGGLEHQRVEADAMRRTEMIISSLSRRALCPDCAHLGGCPHGIPGLIRLPERGEIEPITGKTKSYFLNLIKGTNGVSAVVGYRLLSRPGAARGETYLSGSSYCAALKRGLIKPELDKPRPT